MTDTDNDGLGIETGSSEYFSDLNDVLDSEGRIKHSISGVEKVDSLCDSGHTVFELVKSLHRLYHLDQDTTAAELEVLTLIKQELGEMDGAIDAVEQLIEFEE